MFSQQPFVVDMHKLIGHQRQPRQFRHRIPAVDIAVDPAGKLPIEGIAGSAIADHRCAEGRHLLDGDELALEQPGCQQGQRPPQTVTREPHRPVETLHLRFDAGRERRPDRGDRIDESLVEAGPHSRRREIEAQPPLGHHQQVEGIGEEDILEAIQAGGGFGAAEGHDDLLGVRRQPCLRVALAEEPGLKAEQFGEGECALALGKVGQGTRFAEECRVGRIARGVLLELKSQRAAFN